MLPRSRRWRLILGLAAAEVGIVQVKNFWPGLPPSPRRPFARDRFDPRCPGDGIRRANHPSRRHHQVAVAGVLTMVFLDTEGALIVARRLASRKGWIRYEVGRLPSATVGDRASAPRTRRTLGIVYRPFRAEFSTRDYRRLPFRHLQRRKTAARSPALTARSSHCAGSSIAHVKFLQREFTTRRAARIDVQR